MPNCDNGPYNGTYSPSANNGFGGCQYVFSHGTITGPPNAVLNLVTGYGPPGGCESVYDWSNGTQSWVPPPC